MQQNLHQRARLFFELASIFRTSGLEFSIKTIRHHLTALEVVVVGIISDHDLSLAAVKRILTYWAKCHNKLLQGCDLKGDCGSTFNFDHSITEVATDPVLDIPTTHLHQAMEVEIMALHYYMIREGMSVYPR